ncbi:hypothetical protein H5410_031966 [Solanum commersonii]|uniref:Uncharacterized protein n=1 Tax=Solanum commersonii TaxID=4109 RepID=A0A9J5YN94_SOLCO|nr:hypothetical protein H5410_031966 [Solanum commersonii]
MTHFQGQMSPTVGKPSILPTFMCYSSPSFWCSRIPNSTSLLVFGIPALCFPKIYIDIRYDLIIEPACYHGQTAHFQGQTSPIIGKAPIC